MNTVLDIQGLSVGFGRKQVLRELDLRVHDGAVTVLLGQNGSGKSTLLRVLLGVLRPQAGSVRIFGKDVLREHRAVLQNFNLVVLSATFLSNVYAGRVRSEHLTGMAVVAGSLIIPSIYGSRIYVGMSPVQFRNGVLWILVFAGVTMLAAAAKSMM